MKKIKNKFKLIEIILYILGSFVLSFFKTGIMLYLAFLFTTILEVKNFICKKDFYSILKIMILSTIIPNNYIIIFVTGALCILNFKKVLKCINLKFIVLLFLLLLLNIVLNKTGLLNIFFGIFYLLPILFIFLLLKAFENEIKQCSKKLTGLIKHIVILEVISIVFLAVANINILISGVNANDWITGTFGHQQGNIFLYVMLFALLILKRDYDENKNKKNIIYILISLVLAILTNSIALILFFIFSYFIVTFFKSSLKEKIKNMIILSFAVILFLFLTPPWIKSYIVKLTDFNYFTNNVAKFQVYEDTFINIPKKDLKFFIIGNGIGQYSSRAALTCTGQYINAYSKIFPVSISDYTSNYILNRYIKYNITLGHGTLYSPFSTIISIQGEYGIVGTILFLGFIISLMRKSKPISKIFILFFFFSCFIENYLEFAKIMMLVFTLFFIDKKEKKKVINDNSKKNIMFIIPTLTGGGAEKTVANLSNYLIKDYNVDIVVFKDTELKYSYSGNLITLTKTKNKSVFKKAFFTINSIFKLRKLKKERNIDYAISFLTPADALNVFSKVKGTKTIISIRNTDSILIKNKILRLITYISCQRCDHIIAISNQVKDDIVNYFKVNSDKVTTIYNPSLKIEFGKSEIKFDNEFFSDEVCINVARLADQKGQWHLIRAFSRVVSRYPNAKLIILGQGPLKEYLQKLIDGYRLNDNIFLMGFVDNPYDYIKKSKCFIFSSLYEGLGNSILEALSCGIPVISSDCVSGPREILAPSTNYKDKVKDKIDIAEYGILVPVCDGVKRDSKDNLTREELLLAVAIIEFFDSKMYQHYKTMSEKRSKDFDIDMIIEHWKELLESL